MHLWLQLFKSHDPVTSYHSTVYRRHCAQFVSLSLCNDLINNSYRYFDLLFHILGVIHGFSALFHTFFHFRGFFRGHPFFLAWWNEDLHTWSSYLNLAIVFSFFPLLKVNQDLPKFRFCVSISGVSIACLDVKIHFLSSSIRIWLNSCIVHYVFFCFIFYTSNKTFLHSCQFYFHHSESCHPLFQISHFPFLVPLHLKMACLAGHNEVQYWIQVNNTHFTNYPNNNFPYWSERHLQFRFHKLIPCVSHRFCFLFSIPAPSHCATYLKCILLSSELRSSLSY